MRALSARGWALEGPRITASGAADNRGYRQPQPQQRLSRGWTRMTRIAPWGGRAPGAGAGRFWGLGGEPRVPGPNGVRGARARLALRAKQLALSPKHPDSMSGPGVPSLAPVAI